MTHSFEIWLLVALPSHHGQARWWGAVLIVPFFGPLLYAVTLDQAAARTAHSPPKLSAGETVKIVLRVDDEHDRVRLTQQPLAVGATTYLRGKEWIDERRERQQSQPQKHDSSSAPAREQMQPGP